MEALNFEMVRIAVALLGCAAAAYQDYKTSFIDEKIIYLMLAAGIFLNFLNLAFTNDLLFLYALIVSIAILLFGYIFYKRGQLGMGDVLLFVAIQQLLPLTPLSLHFLNNAPFSFPDLSGAPEFGWFVIGYLKVIESALFFITIFLLSSFLATLGSSLQYAIYLLNSGKPLRPNKVYALASIFFIIAGGVFLTSYFGYSLLALLFFFLFLASGFFLTFREQILDEIVIQNIAISEIEDEDILAIDRLPKDIVKKYKIDRVLTVKNIQKLKEVQKKEGIKLFPVNKILPRFGPYIFIALVIALLLGNVVDIILLLRAN